MDVFKKESLKFVIGGLLLTAIASVRSEAYAGDLRTCDSRYLVTVTAEAKEYVRFYLETAALEDILVIKSHQKEVGPYEIYSIEAVRFEPSNIIKTYNLMEDLKRRTGVIVECDSILTVQ